VCLGTRNWVKIRQKIRGNGQNFIGKQRQTFYC
jgi:hypothetical protein